MEQFSLKMPDGRIQTIIGEIIKKVEHGVVVHVVKETISRPDSETHDVVSFTHRDMKIKEVDITSHVSNVNLNSQTDFWDDSEY